MQRFFFFLEPFQTPLTFFPSYKDFLVFIRALLIHSVFPSGDSSIEVIRADSSVSFICSSAEKIGKNCGLFYRLVPQVLHSIL